MTLQALEGKERGGNSFKVTFQDYSYYLTCLEVPQNIPLVRLLFIWLIQSSPNMNSLFLEVFIKTFNRNCLILQLSEVAKAVEINKMTKTLKGKAWKSDEHRGLWRVLTYFGKCRRLQKHIGLCTCLETTEMALALTFVLWLCASRK